MLAAFLPPYPFRTQSAPYLWCYYRLLCEWADEPALFITGRDYVCSPPDWEDRWECDPAVQSRLGYYLPDDAMPAQHHYAWLNETRFTIGWQRSTVTQSRHFGAFCASAMMSLKPSYPRC